MRPSQLTATECASGAQALIHINPVAMNRTETPAPHSGAGSLKPIVPFVMTE
jgi:hypothetical protein